LPTSCPASRRSPTRVVTLDALYSTLDIVEVAGATRRPVELVAEIYFELSTQLGLPWLREKIGQLPGDKHWQMLAKAAMQDDLSGLQRTIAGEVLSGGGESSAPDELLALWQERNRRAIERAQQLLVELRATPVADASMLSVALRELRNLG
jgi:glutamate dehydrogenase